MSRYLNEDVAFPGDNELIRAYLDQWVASPAWDAPPGVGGDYQKVLDRLRIEIKTIRRRAELDRFIEELIDMAMDPL